MEQIIGINAGLVWGVLSEQGEMNLKGLKKATKLKDKDVWAAMGWLARESKIAIKEDADDVIVLLLN